MDKLTELDKISMEKYGEPFNKLCSARQSTVSTIFKGRQRDNRLR